MSAELKIIMLGARAFITDKLIGFRCTKERYTPYSSLTVTALLDDSDDISDVLQVRFDIDEKIVHCGAMDSLTITKSGGRRIMKITSRSYTSQLTQNELSPGILSDVSLNSLMSEQVYLPYITWQNSSTTVRYINVEEHDSLWSAIVSLSLTLNEQYPFVGEQNEVRITGKAEHSIITPLNVFEEGSVGDYTKLVSHYHMKDVNDVYRYSFSDGYAVSRGITRHKYIPYDSQFAALSHMGLKYRLNYSERGCAGRFLTYRGYMGEELLDEVVFPDETVMDISAVEICGNSKKGIFTRVYAYTDKYCNT